MTGLLSLVAAVALAGLLAWIASGLLLRTVGGVLTVIGLILTATTGSPATAIVAALGAALWLAGHWIYAVRHHYYRSQLARRIFLTALPATLDPTRGWGIPNIPRRASRREDDR
jgi:hypothetical protein